ncbi:PREDICTED: uncharacterized protein LOC109211084 [Nicotiana attenuata]|uniref:uncharacterized protein LOC109211084 n=1 Tax=Nicotiana attenuata TaxID=49451 RepID=UPI000904890A|nr:PREDICTED: uncharacterized protein LOC109211084 [Nicotiana attenuata]
MINGSLPKQQFIVWMAMHRRLATVDRLMKWGIQVEQGGVLCERDLTETHEHLFFECSYSNKLWESMLTWLGYHRRTQDWEEEVNWLIKNVNNRNPKRAILGVVFAAVMYNIGMERNNRRFQQCKKTVQDRAKDIAVQIHVTGQKELKWKPLLERLNNYPSCIYDSYMFVIE